MWGIASFYYIIAGVALGVGRGTPDCEGAFLRAFETSSPATHTITRPEAIELGVFEWARLARPYFETEWGARYAEWLLQNPLQDAGLIRMKHEAIRAFENQALNASVRGALLPIRRYEERTQFWDRFFRALKRLVGLKNLEEIEESRSVALLTEALTKEVTLRNRISIGAFQWVLPASYLLLKFGMEGIADAGARTSEQELVLQLLPLVGVSLQIPAKIMHQQTRTLLTPWKLYLRSAKQLQVALQETRVPYLVQYRERLTTHLEAAQTSDRALQRLLASLHLSPLTHSIDLSRVSNLYLPVLEGQARRKLHRFYELVALVSEADALLAGARLREERGFRLPVVLDTDIGAESAEILRIEGGVHPQFQIQGQSSVPNSVIFERRRPVIYLTGGNAHGKSTFLRMIGLNALLAHAGFPVSAERFDFAPFRLFSTMGKGDALDEGLSSFRMDARRVSQVIERLEGDRPPLILVDEIFSGTSIRERLQAEQGLVQFFLHQSQGFALVSSHNRESRFAEAEHPRVVRLHASDQPESRFQILPGPSTVRNARDILQEEGLPQAVLDFVEGD